MGNEDFGKYFFEIGVLNEVVEVFGCMCYDVMIVK